MPEIVKIGSQNRITLPKSICEELNLKPGDHVRLEITAGKKFLVMKI